jgi:hypothetical protein
MVGPPTNTRRRPGKKEKITTGVSKMMQMREMTNRKLEDQGTMNKLNTKLTACNRFQEDLLG